MRLVLLKEIPESADLRRQWNALVDGASQPQIFYTYEWSLAVQRAYAATLHPIIFLAYDEQESLAGVAALALDDQRRASFLCATTGDYCDFISRSEHRSDFISGVLRELRRQGIEDIALTNLPADSDSCGVLRQACRQNGYRCFARTAYICARIVLAQLERRPEEGKPVLPRKKMVRRFLNAMGREEPVRLDHARTWERVSPILGDFMQAHVARFLVTGRISNAARAERRVLLEELAKSLSEPGWLVLTRMMSGKKIFAWNYGFRYRQTWFWYQPTFDSDLEKYSPGFCLLAKLIEEAADDPELTIVDLGLGAEEYKDRFANQTRETLYVKLSSSAASHYRERLRYYASELVRTSPKAEKSARALLGWWSRLRAHITGQPLAAKVSWIAGRSLELFWLQREVFFYEFGAAVQQDLTSWQLRSLDLDALASAVIQYADDPATLQYLLRAASRLRTGKAEGYGLVAPDGRIVHFAWATRFAGFVLSELNAAVDAPSDDCVMLFDCWTPARERGHGYYGRAIALIAAIVRNRGQRPWIFSARSNVASVHGVEKSGFERRYSLIRKRLLGWQWIKGKTPISQAVPVAEVSARV